MIFLLYIIILAYGVQIGVSVASEKSNCSIEILITICSPNAMIFGKVIAEAVAGIILASIMLVSAYLAYQWNAGVWNHAWEAFLQIPDSLLANILSYFPFTSYMSMFIKVAMGVATIPQILISLVILIFTLIGIVILGAKLYRRGTLSYGNKVNIAAAIKMLKSK